MSLLDGDEDEEFLKEGLIHGFRLAPDGTVFMYSDMNNYKSAINPLVKDKVEETIMDEIRQGNYIVTGDRPTIISALGAIPKPDSQEVRLIHDCSMPKGQALNEYLDIEHFKYQTLDDALKMIKPGYYLSKVDLRHAYRSVPIHPSNYEATGLKWQFKGNKLKYSFLVDSRLPFGAGKSPEIFHRLTQAVRRIMAKRGFDTIIVYLDDFLIVGETKEACQLAFDTLITLLQHLGFEISWRKVIRPTQKLVFLGIEIDTFACTIALPQDKLLLLKEFLIDFSSKCRASKRQLQKLAGKLNWACKVIYGGRTFLRRILDQMSALKSPHAKLKLSPEFFKDLQWWITFLETFNGKQKFLDERPVEDVQTDSSFMAAGAFYKGDWLYHVFACDSPQYKDLHINFKEVLAIYFAALRWAHCWSNKRIIIYTDSKAAMHIINKGSTFNPIVMDALRHMFWLSALFNFKLTARHISGQCNTIADAISRIHEFKYLMYFYHILQGLYPSSLLHNMPLGRHMPLLSFLFLSFRFQRH